MWFFFMVWDRAGSIPRAMAPRAMPGRMHLGLLARLCLRSCPTTGHRHRHCQVALKEIMLGEECQRVVDKSQ